MSSSISPTNKKSSQLIRLNSKPLLKMDTSPLKGGGNGSPSVLKLKRLKSVEDFQPKNKISLIRHYHKNILIDDGDDN
jgi:hypothetical protein